MVHLPRSHSRAELLRAVAGLTLAGAAGLIRPLGGALGATPAGPTLVSRDEPLGAGRGLAGGTRLLPARPAPAFHAIGLHWQGDGTVSFRVGRPGGWSDWLPATSHELPDPGGPEDGQGRWHIGTPVWTGQSNAVQYRLEGPVSALRAHFVRSAPTGAARSLAVATRPPILLRSEWGADETIVRAKPLYADRLRGAIVHHTAGRAPTSPEESAAIVRAIQVYHVKANGWNDIGYNFLVDPFGQIFEGRGGGIERPVVGAHAAGYNTASVGMAVLGEYGATSVTGEVRSALASLLSWRLDAAHVDPLSRTVLGGADLRCVSGHRDVNSTACPGDTLYAEIDAIAAAGQALGLPKLYDPRVELLGERLMRFTARFSEPLAWTLGVTTTENDPVTSTTGFGALVDWTWDATAVPDGRYRWTISSASGGARPATGTVLVGAQPPPVEAPPPPARPPGVPTRIPGWAWELAAWHRRPKADRGPRPTSAPRRVPRWYWSWFSWRVALDRWRREYGG